MASGMSHLKAEPFTQYPRLQETILRDTLALSLPIQRPGLVTQTLEGSQRAHL